MKPKKRLCGFTMIEVLIVIATIATLAAVVIVALNPGNSLAKARNGQRYADISAILVAIYQYQIDHGTIPGSIGIGETEICNSGADCSDSSYVDLHELTDNERYLVSIPRDPTHSTEQSSGYSIIKSKRHNRITIRAPHAELGEEISVSR